MAASILAVCGVDGVGKTTLVQHLQKVLPANGVCFLKKYEKRNEHLVHGFHVRSRSNFNDYNSGSFARVLAVATALDFLSYYENTLVPVLADSSTELIVLDRYIPCYATYLHAVSADVDCAQLFSRLPLADLTILVGVQPSLLPRRYEMRGGATEDENTELMQASAALYPSICNQYSKHVSEIDNSGSLVETKRRLGRLVWEHFKINLQADL